jgi:hypothetical protein
MAMVLVVLAAGCIAVSAAQAGGGVKTLIDDASDGVVNGTYSASVVRSALAEVRSDPAYTMYSDIEGVLVDYLASITHTPKPTHSATPQSTPTAGSTSTATSKATPTSTKSPQPDKTRTASPTPTLSPGMTSAAPSPLPSATAWNQAKSRLAAVPWLFGVLVVGIIAGVILLRRRSK